MRDKYPAIIALGVIGGLCVAFDVSYAKEVVLMIIGVVSAVIRD
jgi:hypothetical protein